MDRINYERNNKITVIIKIYIERKQSGFHSLNSWMSITSSSLKPLTYNSLLNGNAITLLCNRKMVLSLINVNNKFCVINVKRAMKWTRGILNCECAMCVGIDPLLLERMCGIPSKWAFWYTYLPRTQIKKHNAHSLFLIVFLL